MDESIQRESGSTRYGPMTETATVGGDMLRWKTWTRRNSRSAIMTETNRLADTKLPKPHTSYPSLDRAVVLFELIVQIRVGSCVTVLPSAERIA